MYSATAIFEPTFALLTIKLTFDFELAPSESSFTRFKINGVIFEPSIFYSFASYKAVSIANLILSLCSLSSSGIGTVTRIPWFIYMSQVALINEAT